MKINGNDMINSDENRDDKSVRVFTFHRLAWGLILDLCHR